MSEVNIDQKEGGNVENGKKKEVEIAGELEKETVILGVGVEGNNNDDDYNITDGDTGTDGVTDVDTGTDGEAGKITGGNYRTSDGGGGEQRVDYHLVNMQCC
jgi:hypothetical protein